MIIATKTQILGSRNSLVEGTKFLCQVVTSPESLVGKWTTVVFYKKTEDPKFRLLLAAKAWHAATVNTRAAHADVHAKVIDRISYYGDLGRGFGFCIAAAFIGGVEGGYLRDWAKASDFDLAYEGNAAAARMTNLFPSDD